jgi:hypothetical protein
MTHTTGEPFPSAEAAWLWACAAHSSIPKASAIDAAMRSLCRRGDIDNTHTRVAYIWGERGRAPDPAIADERTQARLWTEAMDALTWPLIVCGIVVRASKNAEQNEATL